MEWYYVLAARFGAILVLMVAGFPVGVAFLAVNVVAAAVYFGGSGTVLERIELGIATLADNGLGSMAKIGRAHV